MLRGTRASAAGESFGCRRFSSSDTGERPREACEVELFAKAQTEEREAPQVVDGCLPVDKYGSLKVGPLVRKAARKQRSLARALS